MGATVTTEAVSKPESEKAPVLPAPSAKAEATTKAEPAFAALDLTVVKSAEDLLPLGLDHLKAELQRRGFPCGGTLQQRADRLIEIKTTGGVAKKKKKRNRRQ